MTDWIYDLETYPNVFLCNARNTQDGTCVAYEISDWRDDGAHIIQMMDILKANGDRMVGFNNIAFDYPILHMLYMMRKATALQLYGKAMAIIQSARSDWTHWVKPSDRVVQQIDLYKIHHFDNKARTTGLKLLEFNLRMDNIQELPIEVGTTLTYKQARILQDYCWNDIEATERFYQETKPMIQFRELLSKKLNRDFMNHNDTKIGKDFFIMSLEKAGVQCYEYRPQGRQPKQTQRNQIALSDAILPWIDFKSREFNIFLQWLKRQVITETKGVFKNVSVVYKGFEFVFGLGGIHGSVESRVLESDNEHSIIDLDVTSYYPSIAIQNRFYPEHLGEKFCDIYAGLKEQRTKYAKGTPENAMLKLALNGVYGDSNNPYSVFYDPLFTMKITLNGQLLLCVLAEELMALDGLWLIQMNTDGLTIRIPRRLKPKVDMIKNWWQWVTGLELEEVEYSRMFIRDVNNYIAECAK